MFAVVVVLSVGSAAGTVAWATQSAQPTVSVRDARVLEGGPRERNVLQFIVALSRPTSTQVRLTLATMDRTATSIGSLRDYVSRTAGKVLISPGHRFAFFNVMVIGDKRPELNERLKVTILAARGATIGRRTATGTLVNDDASPLTSSRSCGRARTCAS
jgi:hypothetical protein